MSFEEKLKKFQEEMKIDKNDLDTALQQQADVYHKVCMEYVYAQSRRDEAAEELKRTDAQLNLDVRKAFESSGEKATEARISAEVQLNSKHHAAFDKVSKATLEASLWGTLKEGFHQRAFMLREMAGLYVSGYWVGDSNHKEFGARAEKASQLPEGANTTRRVRSDL